MLRIGTTKSNAFTLIELMVVMTLLVVVVAVTFPSLQRFFRERTLESEGRRILALTRYAQSRAVSEGVPMEMWFDLKRRTYGVEAQPGFIDRDDKAPPPFDLDEKLEMEVIQRPVNSLQMSESTAHRTTAKNRDANIPEIRFSPDGTVDLLSPDGICVREAKDRSHAVWINQSVNRRGYEVDDQAPIQRR